MKFLQCSFCGDKRDYETVKCKCGAQAASTIDTVERKKLQNQKHVKKVLQVLDWLLDHNQEDARVTIGCKTCKEKNVLMASTARTAWLMPFHADHEVWIKNPWGKK